MKTLPAAELFDLLIQNHVESSKFIILDESYLIPKKSWFFGPFADSLRDNLFALGVSSWKPEVNDCDSFAVAGRHWANVLHARSTNIEAGISIGEFYYYKNVDEMTDKHAINIAVVDNEGKLEVVFMEPQNGRKLILTKDQKRNCEAYII